MVVVQLCGGLGNQLFQFSFGISVSIRNKQKIFFDTEPLRNDYLSRKYSLHFLKPPPKILINTFIKKAITKGTKLNILLKRLHFLKEIIEDEFTFKHNILITKRPITYYSGYWQSHKYFDVIRTQILQQVKINSEKVQQLYQTLLSKKNNVSIHVRRTDYMSENRLGFIGLKYYENALRLIMEKIPDAHLVLFSDDITWCKKKFSSVGILYIEEKYGLKDYEELLLMSYCNHNIIANSSFSWWGAWLNENEKKIVVRPERPFNDNSFYYENYYPDEWISVTG